MVNLANSWFQSILNFFAVFAIHSGWGGKTVAFDKMDYSLRSQELSIDIFWMWFFFNVPFISFWVRNFLSELHLKVNKIKMSNFKIHNWALDTKKFSKYSWTKLVSILIKFCEKLIFTERELILNVFKFCIGHLINIHRTSRNHCSLRISYLVIIFHLPDHLWLRINKSSSPNQRWSF